MSSKKRKTLLTEEQRGPLKQLHIAQVGAEISLVVTIVLILTINIASVLPAYGALIALGLLLSCLTLFIFGIALTISLTSLRSAAQPLANSRATPRNWAFATWGAMLTAIILFFAYPPFGDGTFHPERLGLMGFPLIDALLFCILALVTSQQLWRRFNRKPGISPRFFVYGSLGLVLLLTTLLGSYTSVETIPFAKISSSDNNLELGQSEVRQIGKNGAKESQRNLLFGFETSTHTTDPTDEITAKGTRRYQYMHCSNGSYRYYTNDQFKDPTVGFTHQSPDSCAQNGQGTQTTISDSPPAEKIIQQVPTYRTPSYHSTTCTPSYFGNSITCSGYY